MADQDPLDDYLDEREKRAADRRNNDIQLWQTWKAAPSPTTLQPLLNRFEPDFNKTVRRIKAPNVSESALRADLTTHAIRAFETYDPDKAALGTHVNNMMRKSLRKVHQTQNLAYLPEAKAEKIGPIKGATDALRDDLGREPTASEIADYMNESTPGKKLMTPNQVVAIQRGQPKDIFASSFESDPSAKASPREQEVLSLLRFSLKPDEQQVFDHLYGLNGKARITSTGQIATKLGRSPSQVSRIKKRIEAEYKKSY